MKRNLLIICAVASGIVLGILFNRFLDIQNRKKTDSQSVEMNKSNPEEKGKEECDAATEERVNRGHDENHINQ